MIPGAARHRDRQLRGRVGGEGIEQGGDAGRDAGPHEDVIHAAEHRAVDRGGRGQLDLLQVVDAHRPVVPLLGQEHLGEIGRHGQFGTCLAGAQAEAGDRPERLRRIEPARNEIPGHDPFGRGGHGEVRQGPAQVPAGVAELEAPREGRVERDPGDHPELARPGHGAGQLPAGHPDAHAALDDRRPATAADAVLGRAGLLSH